MDDRQWPWAEKGKVLQLHGHVISPKPVQHQCYKDKLMSHGFQKVTLTFPKYISLGCMKMFQLQIYKPTLTQLKLLWRLVQHYPSGHMLCALSTCYGRPADVAT